MDLHMIDYQGNIYKVFRVGDLLISENLKSTFYNDGTPIIWTEDPHKWSNSLEPMGCYINNDSKTLSTYGALYNFHAVNTGKLAPKGWHIPTDKEWDSINRQLSKEKSIIELLDTSFPSYRNGNDGSFSNLGAQGRWWSSTPSSSPNSYYRYLYSSAGVGTSFTRSYDYRPGGFSVRCIRELTSFEEDYFSYITSKTIPSLHTFSDLDIFIELRRRCFKGVLHKDEEYII